MFNQALSTAPELSQQFVAAMGNAPETIVLATDEKGVFTCFDGKGLETTPFQPRDYLGKSVYDLFTPNDVPYQQIVGALHGQSALETYQIGERSYTGRMHPVFDAAGQIVGTIGFAIDVTEHQALQLAEREKDRMFQVLFDNLQDPIFIIDRDYTILKSNKAMSDFYHTFSPLVGKKCHSLSQGDELCRGCPAQISFQTGRVAQSFDYRQVQTSRPGLWFEQTTYPVFDVKNEEVCAVICQMHDVSEHKRVEEQIEHFRETVRKQTEEIRKSEAKLRAILQLNSAAICFFDANRKIIYCNDAYETFTGYSKSELLHMHTTDLIDFDDNTTKEYVNLRDQVFSGKKDRIRSMLKHRKKDGSEAWADICITEFRADNARESHYVAIVIDMTDQHRLIEELKALQEKTV